MRSASVASSTAHRCAIRSELGSPVLTVVDSTLTNNGPGSGQGAAIWLSAGTADVSGSTLDTNRAGTGGAIYCGGSAALAVVNSTLSGNLAQTSGGAVAIEGCSATFSHATIAANTAAQGGGIHQRLGTVGIGNSIVATNTDTSPGSYAPDCAGRITSLGANVLGDGSGCQGPADGAMGDQVGDAQNPIDPLLAPLASHGGRTRLHGFYLGSPAQDAAEASQCPPADQRGAQRPEGPRCDIGAFEGGLPRPLDRYLLYKTRPSRRRLCSALSPRNRGARCSSEEDCGGSTEVPKTALCVRARLRRGLGGLAEGAMDTVALQLKRATQLGSPAVAPDQTASDPRIHLRSIKAAPSKGRCDLASPQNAARGCRREEDCGGESGVTGFCLSQAKHSPRVGLQLDNEIHANPDLRFDTKRVDGVLVPTASALEAPLDPPAASGHSVDVYSCLRIKVRRDGDKFPKGVRILLGDGFGAPRLFEVKKPLRLCSPVRWDGVPWRDPSTHLACYRVRKTRGEPAHAGVTDLVLSSGLATELVDTVRVTELCVPTTVVP